MKKNNLVLICPDFYDYKKHIFNNFKVLSKRHVYCFSERPSGFFYNLARTFSKSYQYKMEEKYIDKILSTINSADIDKVIVIRGEIISDVFVDFFKKRDIPIVNYQWDSIENNHRTKKFISNYDKVYSFDLNDCKKYKFEYLPLFWIYCDFEQLIHNKEIGFIGSYHGDRLQSLIRYRDRLKIKGYNLNFKLYMPILAYIKNLLNGNFIPIKYLFFRKLKSNEIERYYSKFSYVFELPSSKQSGIPLRLFESIALGKLIITDCDKGFIDNAIPSLSKYILTIKEIENDKEMSDKIIFDDISGYNIKFWVEKLLNND